MTNDNSTEIARGIIKAKLFFWLMRNPRYIVYPILVFGALMFFGGESQKEQRAEQAVQEQQRQKQIKEDAKNWRDKVR